MVDFVILFIVQYGCERVSHLFSFSNNFFPLISGDLPSLKEKKKKKKKKKGKKKKHPIFPLKTTEP